MFKLFGQVTEVLNFPEALLYLSLEDHEEATRKYIGAQIHEVFKISIENDQDVFQYTQPLINCLNSDDQLVFLSPLQNLAMTIQVLNLNFKKKLVGRENFEMEKFSLKEAQKDDEIDKLSQILWDLTLGLLNLEN